MSRLEGIVRTFSEISGMHPGVVAVSGQILRDRLPTVEEEVQEAKQRNNALILERTKSESASLEAGEMA